MSKEILLVIPPELDGERADRAVAALLPELSRSLASRFIIDGRVTVNASPLSKSRVIRAGDELKVVLPAPVSFSAEAEDLPLDIRYEDDDLLVVNKPRGMVVHPAAGNYGGTLVNALMYHRAGNLSEINGAKRPGIVHRIDKDTSGLLIVAKNDFAHKSLAAQIKEHSFKREYRAVVTGNVKDDTGTVDAPVGRSERNRKKQAVGAKNSRNAVTHFEVLERLSGYTYMKLRLETGRTHQIRVHMAYRGNPVAGDTVYGGAKNKCGLDGQCLHASLVGFVHPVTGEYIEVVSELPDYFENFLRRIR